MSSTSDLTAAKRHYELEASSEKPGQLAARDLFDVFHSGLEAINHLPVDKVAVIILGNLQSDNQLVGCKIVQGLSDNSFYLTSSISDIYQN